MSEVLERMRARASGLLVLVDPGRTDAPTAAAVARAADEAGAAALMIGSSFDGSEHTETVARAMKGAAALPLLLFPGSAAQLTPTVQKMKSCILRSKPGGSKRRTL